MHSLAGLPCNNFTHSRGAVQREVLVMEDDMEILRWPTPGVLDGAPLGWGALQLYMLGNTANKLYSAPPAPWVPWAPGIFNTGAYIINRRGMERVGTWHSRAWASGLWVCMCAACARAGALSQL